ncbi:response regulator transcription factor [Euzebya tangerina]|uniref:response regulator transcription factor n=1 Tax=Euzebya tangerina TaxID=591198 RepID=UPI000E30F7ED|nr:response regulator transcription factor [Euzebya tangerina]
MTVSGPTVLVVDDDDQLRRALDINLRIREYEVLLASDGAEALRLLASHRPDLVILDLGLPGMDGVEVIAGARGWSSVPIMVLSARDQEVDKVAALDAGADDYLTKPFGMDEALARVRALLRRRWHGEDDPVVTTSCVVIDLARHEVSATPEGQPIHLTPTEWTILEILARNAGRLVTRDALVGELWGGSQAIDPSAIRVHLSNLRRKLEQDPTRPCCLRTEQGMGYRLQAG